MLHVVCGTTNEVMRCTNEQLFPQICTGEQYMANNCGAWKYVLLFDPMMNRKIHFDGLNPELFLKCVLTRSGRVHYRPPIKNHHTDHLRWKFGYYLAIEQSEFGQRRFGILQLHIHCGYQLYVVNAKSTRGNRPCKIQSKSFTFTMNYTTVLILHIFRDWSRPRSPQREPLQPHCRKVQHWMKTFNLSFQVSLKNSERHFSGSQSAEPCS